VTADDLPSRTHASRLTACSGMQATPHAFGASEPPGRRAPLPGSPVALHRRIAPVWLRLADGRRFLRLAPHPSPSSSQPHGSASSDGIAVDDAFSSLSPCRRTACSGVQATPDPFGGPVPPGLPGTPSWLTWVAPLKHSRGLATVSKTCVSFPAVELTTSRSPRALDVASCDSPFGFTCVASRLAQVCKLPLALSVSQNPPGRRAPAQVAHAPSSDCSGLVLACGLASVSVGLAPGFPRRRAHNLTVPQAPIDD